MFVCSFSSVVIDCSFHLSITAIIYIFIPKACTTRFGFLTLFIIDLLNFWMTGCVAVATKYRWSKTNANSPRWILRVFDAGQRCGYEFRLFVTCRTVVPFLFCSVVASLVRTGCCWRQIFPLFYRVNFLGMYGVRVFGAHSIFGYHGTPYSAHHNSCGIF